MGAFSGLNVPSDIKNESSVSYKAPALRQSRTLSLGFRDFCLEPRVDITVDHKTKNPGSKMGFTAVGLFCRAEGALTKLCCIHKVDS